MKIQSDFLAKVFRWSDEVIDAAQSPAVRLASTLLPVLAPLIPAFITAIKLHALYVELIAGRFPDWVATSGAVVTAVVLEFLGWVGTIAFVRNLFKWVKTKEEEYLIPTSLSFLAYVGYVADLWAVNSSRVSTDSIILLLSLFSIPAGFMFAVLLVTGEGDKEDEKLRQESREDRMKLKLAKLGIKPDVVYASDVPQVREVKEKHASDYRDKAIEFIEKFYEQNRSRPTPKHLTERFSLEHSKNKGYMSSLIKEVYDGHGWQ